ncbi:MAG: hypothetical protein QXP59_06535 [Saccharolobus sp.]|uniref:hypothetical protein n=1 Tax=Saccharolobus sp. TaxID=2100761 RepID=UPI003162B3A0
MKKDVDVEKIKSQVLLTYAALKKESSIKAVLESLEKLKNDFKELEEEKKKRKGGRKNTYEKLLEAKLKVVEMGLMYKRDPKEILEILKTIDHQVDEAREKYKKLKAKEEKQKL